MEPVRRLMVTGFRDMVVFTLIAEKDGRATRSYGARITKDAARELADHLNAAINVSEGWYDGEVSGVKFE